MNAFRTQVHVEIVPVRWGDLDALGHVNNTLYFRYMEQARIAWLASHGYRLDPSTEIEGPVIVNAQCTFRRPILYPATVEVRLALDTPGRSSVETRYALSVNGEEYADGSAKMVWVDYRSGKSIPLPEALRPQPEGG